MASAVISPISEILRDLYEFIQKILYDPVNLLMLVIFSFIAVWFLVEYSAWGRLPREL